MQYEDKVKKNEIFGALIQSSAMFQNVVSPACQRCPHEHGATFLQDCDYPNCTAVELIEVSAAPTPEQLP